VKILNDREVEIIVNGFKLGFWIANLISIYSELRDAKT
jgi:hypothetical protein